MNRSNFIKTIGMGAIGGVSLAQWPIVASAEETHPTRGTKRLRIIFITTCVEEAFFKPVEKGMRDAAAMMNVDCTNC